MSREPPRSGWRDIAAGLAGVSVMIGALLTPFLRGARSAWGVGSAAAKDRFPGDDLVPQPRWEWAHGIDIRGPADAVWPWVAQIGADRGGFYSYQWLENLIGCRISNAAEIHPEWAHHTGGQLSLHPQAPPLRVAAVEDRRFLVAYLPPTATLSADSAGERPSSPARRSRWITASWLFLVQPCGAARCRVISRFRCATSSDLASRLQFGPALVEPVSFAMDRRMLIGIKQRAERTPTSRE